MNEIIQYRGQNAVPAMWLVQNNVVSNASVQKMAQRGQLTMLRRGAKSTPALVAFDTMPDSLIQASIEALGYDPRDRKESTPISDRIEPSAEAKMFFDSYTDNQGRHLPDNRIREYYANAVLLNAIGKWIKHSLSMRGASGGRTATNWQMIGEWCTTVDRSAWPHQLPTNVRSLERKYREYVREGYIALVHDSYKTSQRNAAKVTEDAQRQQLLSLVACCNNLDMQTVANLYNEIASAKGWPSVSASTVARFYEQNKMIADYGRKGERHYDNTIRMQATRKAPEGAMLMWTMDGWDVELCYQSVVEDKDGHKKTVYHKRLTLMVVLDVATKYPIGYCLATQEKYDYIRKALQDAVRHTEKIFGHMYLPDQIQCDRYDIKNVLPLIADLCDKATPTRAHNAKAKIIEPWFKYFNNTYCRMAQNWSGHGVKSKDQPNFESPARAKQLFPTIEECAVQVMMYMERERERLHDAYMEAWGRTPDAKRVQLEEDRYLSIFGATTGRRNLLQPQGIRLMIDKQEHIYDCFDIEMRKHPSERWEMKYDEQDPEHRYALAVSEDGRLQFLCEKKHIQPMCLTDQTDEDRKALERMNDFNHSLHQQLKEINETLLPLQQATFEREQQKNLEMLHKTVALADSRGQHKDLRNATKLGIEDHEYIVANTNDIENEMLDLY